MAYKYLYKYEGINGERKISTVHMLIGHEFANEEEVSEWIFANEKPKPPLVRISRVIDPHNDGDIYFDYGARPFFYVLMKEQWE